MPVTHSGGQRHPAQPRTVAEVLDALDEELRSGAAKDLVPLPTRFDPLDAVLGGGIRSGDLVLIGGTPGVGKTIATLQMARNIAIDGGIAVYVCYEHEESVLLSRLLAMELGDLDHSSDDAEMEKLRMGIQEAAMGVGAGLRELLEGGEVVTRAYERLRTYADRLFFVKASGAHTGLEEIEDIVRTHKPANGSFVLFVDYLQKVSVRPEPADEGEKVTRITESLKDLALQYRIPIVSIVAADREGLKAKRLRLHHLRGSSALMYECDVALILNDKFNCVAKVHLAYDPVRAETFRDYTVFTVEKNRGGPNLVDLEFRKDFVYYRFNSIGGLVQEKLVDERIHAE